MSIMLTRPQAIALAALVAINDGDVYLTAQKRGTVYAAFTDRSFTLTPDGATIEEDFGMVCARDEDRVQTFGGPGAAPYR